MLMQQIKYFLAVVNCKSFTEAAEQCYITQSAISQQIKSLEQELGVRLIQRGKRKFALTPEGDYFYRNCLLLTKDFEDLKNKTKQISRLKANKLRIGLLNNYAGSEPLDAASALLAKYPGMSLELVNGTHDDLCKMLAQDKIDLAINDLRHAVNNDYVCCQLTSVPCYIAVSLQSPLCSLPSVTSDDLHSFSCIVITPQSLSGKDEKHFLGLILELSDNFLHASSLKEALFMVACNKGYLPMDIYSLNFTRYTDSIRCLPFYRQGKQASIPYFIFWKRKNQNASIEEFSRILSEKFNIA